MGALLLPAVAAVADTAPVGIAGHIAAARRFADSRLAVVVQTGFHSFLRITPSGQA